MTFRPTTQLVVFNYSWQSSCESVHGDRASFQVFNTNIPSLPSPYGMNTVFVPPNYPIMIALVLPGEVVEDSGGCDSSGAQIMVLAVTTAETMVCPRI